MDWKAEIDELHDFFEAYFLGAIDSLQRVDEAFDADLTHVGPDGVEHDRAGVMAALEAGFNHTDSLTITCREHRLLVDDGELVVAAFVEDHLLSSRANSRRHTVVFRRDGAAPNGLAWLRVQETWIDQGR